MRRTPAGALALAALTWTAASAGAATPEIPPAPTRWVTDQAGLLSPAVRATLDARLEAFERTTGHQVLVYIGRSTGGVPIEDFVVRAFAKWRVGRKGMDDGLVLFVFPEDRRLRIEVGYGLEGAVPDVLAGRIVRDVMAPLLAAGRSDEAVRTGVDAILKTISGEEGVAMEGAPGPAAGYQERPAHRQARPMSLGQKILVGFLVLGFIILLITNPQLAIFLLFSMLSGGRGGGLGGGGGGFSGGGGRSGGGGASGSW
jgi:uncharacterized protein